MSGAEGRPLVIVSNRGPAQFERDADGNRVVSRGGGGLVSALTDLVSHRHALWVASALTDEDVAVSAEAGGLANRRCSFLLKPEISVKVSAWRGF